MPLRDRDYMHGEPDEPPYVHDKVQGRYMKRAEYKALTAQRKEALEPPPRVRLTFVPARL